MNTYFDITESHGAPTPTELEETLERANNTIHGLLDCLTELENENFELNETVMKYYHLYGPLPDDDNPTAAE